jgi:hypothetical protein
MPSNRNSCHMLRELSRCLHITCGTLPHASDMLDPCTRTLTRPSLLSSLLHPACLQVYKALYDGVQVVAAKVLTGLNDERVLDSFVREVRCCPLPLHTALAAALQGAPLWRVVLLAESLQCARSLCSPIRSHCPFSCCSASTPLTAAAAVLSGVLIRAVTLHSPSFCCSVVITALRCAALCCAAGGHFEGHAG